MSPYYLFQIGTLMALSWIVGHMLGEAQANRRARKTERRRQADASLAAVAAARGRHPSAR